MKWLLDLVWPKSPKTMAEVESSYGNSPYENLRPPAWKGDYSQSTVQELRIALNEAGDNKRAVRLLELLIAVFPIANVPFSTTTLFGLMDNGDYFVTFAQPDRRLTFTVDANGTNSWHSIENQARGGATRSGPLILDCGHLADLLRLHFGEWARSDADVKPPAWKDEPATASNGPTVPEVDSLSRQVVALREEVARVKVEAMRAILEARHEAARDAADWRGERDALAQRLERAETSAKWQTDERKKWEEQNLYEMMQTENRVSMMNLQHGLAIETLEKANEDKDARLKQVESFFPVGWVPGTTYRRYQGNMYISVYPALVESNDGYNFTVSSAKDAHVGMTDAKGFATLSEAMAESERLAEELRVAMEDRTVVGGPVVKQECSEVVRG